MPELIDGMTPEEFLKKVALKRGRPSKELQEKLNRARELVDVQRQKLIEKQTNPELILKRVETSFKVLREAGEAMISGTFNAVCVSGAAGIGKTYTLDQEVFGPAGTKGAINYRKLAGKTTGVQLCKILSQYRSPKSLLLFDDNDAIFQDEDALNVLKAALDTNPIRRVTWLSSTNELEEEEKDFMFEGRVAFITNLDLHNEIQKDNRLTPHIKAFVSRVHYLDLGLHNKHAQALWTVKRVEEEDILVKAKHLTKAQQKQVITYVMGNYDNMAEISIRSAIKIAEYVKMRKNVEDVDDWRDISQIFGY